MYTAIDYRASGVVSGTHRYVHGTGASWCLTYSSTRLPMAHESRLARWVFDAMFTHNVGGFFCAPVRIFTLCTTSSLSLLQQVRLRLPSNLSQPGHLWPSHSFSPSQCFRSSLQPLCWLPLSLLLFLLHLCFLEDRPGADRKSSPTTARPRIKISLVPTAQIPMSTSSRSPLSMVSLVRTAMELTHQQTSAISAVEWLMAHTCSTIAGR